MSDRTIHARVPGNVLIVRYDKAGKWYAEKDGHRAPITLGAAVEMATQIGSYVYLGKPGGMMFDSQVRRASASTEFEKGA